MKTLQLQIFLSEEEEIELKNYKDNEGMSYKAIAEKAFTYFIDNKIPYKKPCKSDDYIFYATIGKKRKQVKRIAVSEQLNSALSEFANKNGYTKSNVAAQAILAYIRREK